MRKRTKLYFCMKRTNFRFLIPSLWVISIIICGALFIQYYLIGDSSIRHLFDDMLRTTGNAEQWFYAGRKTRPRGVALVIHGLNLNPDKMSAIIELFNKQGIDVLNVSLRGHGDNYRRRPGTDAALDRLESFKEVSFLLWLQEAHNAYLKAHLRARRFGVPVFFSGYSLGGLLGCSLVLSHPHVHFDRMILFAPALAVQKKSYLLKPLMPFSGLVIDSLSPTAYRANSGTPVSAYNALFDTLRYFEKHTNGRLNIPTIVFIDKQDEFIDFDALAALILDHNLDQWRIIEVKKDGSVSDKMPHHIIIDKQSVGSAAWQEVTAAITEHLR